MEASIDGQGVLTLTADSGIESYALRKWFEDWEDRKVCLCIDTDHPTNSEARTIRSMRNPDEQTNAT